MKTSNKLLFSAGAGLMMGFIIFLISLRSSLVEIEHVTVEGSGINKIEIKVDSIHGNTYILGNSFDYKLDPNSSNIIIEADEMLHTHLMVIDDENGVEVTWKPKNMSRSYDLPIIITLGTARKNVLSLKINQDATVNTLGPLDADLITLKVDDDVKGSLELNSRTVEFKMDDNVDLNIKGRAEVVNLDLYDNAKLRGNNFSTKTAIIDLDGNAEVFFQSLDFGSGVIRGNSTIHTGSDPQLVKVRKRGNAEVKTL